MSETKIVAVSKSEMVDTANTVITTEYDWIADRVEKIFLPELNEHCKEEPWKNSNAFYVRYVDNHIEIGYAEVKFIR